jgi:cobalt-zinc-cadmium efflux system protein
MSGSRNPAGAADGPVGHHHEPAAYDRAFAAGIVLNLGYVAVEAFFGFASNSLALLADAGHNLGDVGGLLLAWAAAWLTRRASTQRHTYGFGRASIMASLINACVLLVTVGGIAWEAIRRLPDPQPVAGETVMWVAAVGIVVNAGTAAMFMRGSKSDLNIRGAFLHMAADAGVTLGVVIAALVISLTGWLWLDPAVSLGIGLVIAIGSWGLFRESLNLAMDAVPAGIDRAAVAEFLSEVPGVVAVHDLHIWPLSTSSVAMTAHLVKPDAIVDDTLLCRLSDVLHERFDIDHATLQIEHGGGDCPLTDVHAPAPDRRS